MEREKPTSTDIVRKTNLTSLWPLLIGISAVMSRDSAVNKRSTVYVESGSDGFEAQQTQVKREVKGWLADWQ